MRSLESLIFMRSLYEGEVMSHFKPFDRFRRNLARELYRLMCIFLHVFLEVLHTSLTLKFINTVYKLLLYYKSIRTIILQ